MEGVKKQAEALTQLEGELAKSRKQERTYEEANEVLQRDLDKMEAELAKLKQSAAAAEKQGASFPLVPSSRVELLTISEQVPPRPRLPVPTLSPTRATSKRPTSSRKSPPSVPPSASSARRTPSSNRKTSSQHSTLSLHTTSRLLHPSRPNRATSRTTTPFLRRLDRSSPLLLPPSLCKLSRLNLASFFAKPAFSPPPLASSMSLPSLLLPPHPPPPRAPLRPVDHGNPQNAILATSFGRRRSALVNFRGRWSD
jgi:hypothetical protein